MAMNSNFLVINEVLLLSTVVLLEVATISSLRFVRYFAFLNRRNKAFIDLQASRTLKEVSDEDRR
jgi:hypothetical protein